MVMAEQVFALRDVQTNQVHPVDPAGARVGRVREENDIVLNAGKSSRYHATLWVQNGQLYVRDEGSTNGTWVNGQQITQPTVVQSGSEIRFGDQAFRVAVETSRVPEPVPMDSVPADNRGFPLVPVLIGGGVVLLILLGLLLRGTGGGTPAASLPTATSTLTPTANPSPTLTPEPEETYTPRPTPTTGSSSQGAAQPSMRYPAPALSSPPDGIGHKGNTGPDLAWSSVGTLTEDEYYRVVVNYPHLGERWEEIGWEKTPQWHVPDYLTLLISNPADCRWWVEVVQVTEYDQDGNPAKWEPISPRSETREFSWPQDGGGGNGGGGTAPTATPGMYP
jgi:pSer/pThr/pTyr-binding forkhead associated (FHA) protein